MVLLLALLSYLQDRDALRMVEEIRINQALWGEDIPNVLKGIPVAYDAKRDRLYSAGITSRYLAITDPVKGRPIAAIDLESRGFRVASLHLDPRRDRLFYVVHSSGSVRAVDLARGRIAAKYDPPRERRRGRGDRYPVKGAAIDESTGRLFVVDSSRDRVTEFDGDDLRIVRTHREIRSPIHAAWDPAGKRILVLEGDRRRPALWSYESATHRWTRLRRFDRSFSPRPPRHVAAGHGRIYLFAERLVALSAKGEELWSAPTEPGARSPIAVGDRVAIVCREGESGPRSGGAYSSVLFYDTETGKRLGRCVVGYEASWASPDTKGHRLFVGNGGDGSVSVVDIRTAKETARLDVANAAEQVVVDPTTGRRFILNRLGGSEIYVWEKGGKDLRVLKAGGWPVDMGLDSARRQLYVLSHYESSVYVIDIDTLKGLGTIPLGVPGCRTDSISDFALDPKTGWGVCALPERSRVAIVDLAARKVIHVWRPSGFRGGPHRGPAGLHVAVDPARNRVLALSPREGEFWVFDPAAGKETRHLRLPGPTSRPKSYAIDLLSVWAERGLAFAGSVVIDLETLTTRTTIHGIDKMVGAAGGRLFGMRVSRSGEESLVEVSPETLRPLAGYRVARSDSIRTVQYIDPASNRLYVADMVRARVRVFALPQ